MFLHEEPRPCERDDPLVRGRRVEHHRLTGGGEGRAETVGNRRWRPPRPAGGLWLR